MVDISDASSKHLWTLLPVEGVPEGRYFSNADEALTKVAAHLKEKSKTAHKERIDLAALHAHSGEKYHTTATVRGPSSSASEGGEGEAKMPTVEG